MGRHDLSSTTIGDLLDDPEVVQIVQRHYPGLSAGDPAIRRVRGMAADEGFRLAAAFVGSDTVDAVRREIEAL